MTRSQRMLDDAIFMQSVGEFEGKTIDSAKENYPENYRGLVLEVNDHGNVTLWQSFKNGNLREIASRV